METATLDVLNVPDGVDEKVIRTRFKENYEILLSDIQKRPVSFRVSMPRKQLEVSPFAGRDKVNFSEINVKSGTFSDKKGHFSMKQKEEENIHPDKGK